MLAVGHCLLLPMALAYTVRLGTMPALRSALPRAAARSAARSVTTAAAMHEGVPSKRWSETLKSQPPPPKHPHSMFCNRELNMGKIEAIGFDMDYTLAAYNTEFDLLAFNGALAKLVLLGYPEEVLKFKYTPEFFTRGLVVDKLRGNILKADRHKYVRVCYHGFRPVDAGQRRKVYQESFDTMPSFTGDDFVNIDSLFQLVDACLYAHLVEFKDAYPDLIDKSYEGIFKDVRKSVDLCHRDGVIKDEVAKNPSKYIIPDPNVVPMLERYKAAGVKTFLLTNSLWEYTNVVMNCLYGGDHNANDLEWTDLFDLVIVGGGKPAFLVDPYLPMFRVNTADGSLRNSEGVSQQASTETTLPKLEEFTKKGKVVQGGNYRQLQTILGIDSGDKLLYVGDHIYSDILRSKRSLGWRTCLVIPELETEAEAYAEHAAGGRDVAELRSLQLQHDVWEDEVKAAIRKAAKAGDAPAEAEGRKKLAEVEEQSAAIKAALSSVGMIYHRKFHPVWGQLFKTGYQGSRFAKQVMDYACLYTSKATNLFYGSPSRTYRTVSMDRMSHDIIIDRKTDGLM